MNDSRVRFEGGPIERKCPACGRWRQAFLIVKASPEVAAFYGVDEVCDNELTHIARHAFASPGDEAPPPSLEELVDAAVARALAAKK